MGTLPGVYELESAHSRGKWLGVASALAAVVCWVMFAQAFSRDLSTTCGPNCRALSTEVGVSVGLWLGGAVALTVLAAAGLIVAWLASALAAAMAEDRTPR
jgi:hypothetical protein